MDRGEVRRVHPQHVALEIESVVAPCFTDATYLFIVQVVDEAGTATPLCQEPMVIYADVGLVDVGLAGPRRGRAVAMAGTLGPGIVSGMVGLVSGWGVGNARVVRGLVLTVRERQFVEAARCLGAGDRRLIVRHVLPNVLPPMVVLSTLEMGGIILAISGLSFLGLGAQPPTPEWGAMLNDARDYWLSAPWALICPGIAITTMVLGFNLLGDGLRDALDPTSR